MSGADRLTPIVRDVRRRLEAHRREIPIAELARRAERARAASPRRSLERAIQGGRHRRRPWIIAEIKRRSPAAGDLSRRTDTAARARAYVHGGARAISVVTEPDHFGGDPADLMRVRPVGLPVLRKDFILDPYQLYESIALGADAVLLIARILDDVTLRDLLARARLLDLECLVEVNTEVDAERAVQAGATLIGINQRDLRSFSLDPERTSRLLPLLPRTAAVVSASGMREPADVFRAHHLGADACLVGEALMRAADPARWLRRVTGGLAAAPDAEAGEVSGKDGTR